MMKIAQEKPNRRRFIQVAALATGGLLVPKDSKLGRGSARRPIRDRKIFFHFMQHKGEDALCGFSGLLRKAKPGKVFVESAFMPYMDAFRFGKLANSRSRIALKNKLGDPLLRGFIQQAWEFAPFSTFLSAEAYSKEEISALQRTSSENKEFQGLTQAELEAGNLEGAVKFIRAREMATARMNMLRHAGILERVGSRMENGECAVLIIGGGHVNLVRLFAEAGYESSFENTPFGADYLPVYYEARERGWNPKRVDEEKLAVKAFALDYLSGLYLKAGFSEEDLPIIRRSAWHALETFTGNKLLRLSRMRNAGVPLGRIVASLDLRVPTTRRGLKARDRELGYACD